MVKKLSGFCDLFLKKLLFARIFHLHFNRNSWNFISELVANNDLFIASIKHFVLLSRHRNKPFARCVLWIWFQCWDYGHWKTKKFHSFLSNIVVYFWLQISRYSIRLYWFNEVMCSQFLTSHLHSFLFLSSFFSRSNKRVKISRAAEEVATRRMTRTKRKSMSHRFQRVWAKRSERQRGQMRPWNYRKSLRIPDVAWNYWN